MITGLPIALAEIGRIDSLFGPATDRRLPVANADPVRRSKPVLSLQRLANWVRDARKEPSEELAELRSEVPA